MKKLFVFILLSMLGMTSQASNKWIAGIEVNANRFSFTDPQLFIDKGYGISYIFNSERYFNKKLSFKTGIGLERKILKYESYYFDSEGDYSEEVTNKLSRINVPFLIAWHFGSNKQLYFDAGMALKLFPRVSSSGVEGNISVNSGVVIAPLIGFGYEISAGNFKIDIGTRINFGLTKRLLFDEYPSGYIRDIGLVFGIKYGW